MATLFMEFAGFTKDMHASKRSAVIGKPPLAATRGKQFYSQWARTTKSVSERGVILSSDNTRSVNKHAYTTHIISLT